MEEYILRLNEIDIRRFPKHMEDSDKYLVITCAKNENSYIREWIQHYLNLNFDKIIICDNNDDESLLTVVSDYIERGVVEVFDCRGLNSFQVQLYSMFCSEGNYKWCAYFDCDEFLELGLYTDIKEYLNTKENEVCISFNWMVYGSNGEIFTDEKGVQERFKKPTYPMATFVENCYIKSIVRGGDTFNNCWFNGSHMPLKSGSYEQCIGGYFWKNNDSHQILPPRYKEGYIKHYYTKSYEEWINKAGRGWPDGTNNLNLYKFFVCNNNLTMPYKDMVNSFFIEKYDSVNDDELFKTYDIFLLLNDSKYICSYMVGAFRLMSRTSGKTFILKGDHIDDTVYNTLLEYALNTNNNVVWANTEEDVWRAYHKYNNGECDTYYIMWF